VPRLTLPTMLTASFRRSILAGLMILAAALAACAPRLPSPAGGGPPLTPPPAAPPTVAPPTPRLTLSQARFSDLPGWTKDAMAAALPALLKSCQRMAKQNPDRPVGPEARFGRTADWLPACRRLETLPATKDATPTLRRLLESDFTPWQASDRGEATGLFTGYYEPSLRGSFTRHGPYQTPLYKRPPELVQVELGEFRPDWRGERLAGQVVNGQLKPYFDRKAIDNGALAGKRLELLYVDSAIDAFFLHIQGSGRVQTPDGKDVRIGYDGQNGHRYVPIGRELAAQGALEIGAVSMQSIRDWLMARPNEAQAMMQRNPSYVFFKVLEGEGPLGAEGVALTPGRSLAVDRAWLAYGMPVWLDAEDPIAPGQRLQRLMAAQDTGGAIRGPVRGDVFWGHGSDAEKRAGMMKSAGRYWLLLPKTVQPVL
jgi:membrane-bound lytic murein transglycosylase A